MGNVRKTRVTTGGRTYEGEALLETSELIVRGEKRIVVKFADIRSIDAKDGRLTINHDLTLDLGDEAAKWAEKIRNPKSVVQKIGVKAGHQVMLVNLSNDAFTHDLESAGAIIGGGKNRDAIFYGANTRDDLAKLSSLRDSLAPNGSLWVIRPKGIKAITESDTMAAGKAAGLVDVKVVKFSETHTAEKFVIAVASRAGQ